jgi:hypothetical protein
MKTSRRILIAVALVTAAAAATAALALGGGTAGAPRKAMVTSHHLRAETVLGSYCSNGETEAGQGVAGCADSEYPLHPRAFLPITPNSSVRVNLRKATKHVRANLVKGLDAPYGFVGPELAAKPVPGSNHRVWRLRLPGDLHDADAIALFARFREGGDADQWVGVKPVERWP